MAQYDLSLARYNNPDYKNHYYEAMAPFWEIVNDVRGGTSVMRARGRLYLPKHPLESTGAYANRKMQSVFFNAFDHTLSGLVGMVFRKDPVLGDDVPDEIRGTEEQRGENGELIKAAIEGDAENIDLRGTHFDVFLREVFDMAAHKGHAFIYVDMPKKLPPGSTLTDERANGQRPYWLRYEPEQAVNWRTRIMGGIEVLDQITFRECTYEPVGLYGEAEVIKYRVLHPGAWELYRIEVTSGTGQPVAVLEDEGATSLDIIPIIPVYGRKLGCLYSQPPLLDLAHLNIAHWQLLSDYRHILHVANVPILMRKGAAPTGTKKGAEGIGPNRIIDVPKDGDLKYVEHQGAAIEKARQELLDIEERMAIVGLQLLARRSNAQAKTATEKILNAAEQSSTLQSMVRGLQDAAEQALAIHARFRGLKSGGQVKINTDFQGLAIDPSKLQVYSQMVQAGQMSLVSLWNVMRTYGELPVDFDAETEKNRLEAEAPLRAIGKPITDKNNFATAVTGPVTPKGGSQNKAGTDAPIRKTQAVQRRAGNTKANRSQL